LARSASNISLLKKAVMKGLDIQDIGNGETDIKDLSRVRIKAEGDLLALMQSAVFFRFP